MKNQQRQREAVLEGAKDLWNAHGSHLFNTEGTARYTAQLTHTGAMPQVKARTEMPTRLFIGGWDFEGEFLIGACTSNCRSTVNPHTKRSLDAARIKEQLREMRCRQSRAESELEELEDINVDQVRDAIEEIRRNLAAQSELQDEILSGVKTKVRPRSHRDL